MNLPFNLLILLSLAACIGAQRAGRINAPAESGADAPTRRSRGRVRFTVPSGVSETDLLDAAAPIERHSESTVRKADRKLTRPSSKPYEVKEVLDDIPNVNARKTHKPRVITETRFEAANAPKKPLYVPLPLPEDEVLPEDIVANFSPQITKYSTEKVEKIAETTVREITTPIVSIPQVAKTEVSTEEILPLTTNLGQSSELTTLGEQQPSTENEIKKIDTTTPDIRKKALEPLQIVTPVNDARKTSRVPSRSRLASSTEAATRTRTRPIRRQDTQDSSEESLVSTSNIRTRPRTRQQQEKSIDASPARQLRSKPIRRRLDNAETALGGGKTKIPSLFSEEDTQDDTLKTRTGRKVNYASTPENDSVQNEEKKHFQRRRPAHVKDRVTNSIESTTITGDTSNNRDVPRSYRNRNGARSPNRSRERTTEAQQVDEAPVPNRRTSIRGRKPSVKYVAIEPVKIEKVPRTRVYNTTEKTTTVKEEESTRSKTKVTTQIESETTTTPPTTKSRRVDYQSRIKPELQSESKIDEKVISTTTQSPSTVENRRSSLRSRIGSRRTKAPSSNDDTTQSPQATTSRNDVRRRSFSRRVNVLEPTVKEPVKEVNRNTRQRTRYIPPIIDEQKLEVLPLFESEAKTVAPIRARQNFESMNAAASSSEHQIKVGTSNEIKIDSPIRVETKTEKSEHIQHIRTVQPTKQSVETKVSEVVTKRKIGRQVVRKIKVNKTNTNNNISGEKSNESNDGERKSVKTVVVPVKGHRRVETSKDNKVSSKLSSSEEDIGDSDNYPEPFKALIQAKLATQSSKKGSRLQQKTASEDRITKSTEKIVTSSRAVSINPSTTTTVRSTTTTTEAPKTTFLKPNDADNELFPHSTATETTRPTRRRFSLTTTTKVPEISEDVSTKYVKRPLYLIRKVARSTVAPSEVSVITEVSAKVKKQPRYHARFSASARNEERVIEKSANSLQNQDGSLKKDQEVVNSTPKARSYSPKPPRGLYSTRKGGKKRTAKQESSVSAQVTNEGKKSGRYSARYRSDIFSRAGSTRPTSAPAYIPTVPTVTTPSDYDWSEGYQWSFNRIN